MGGVTSTAQRGFYMQIHDGTPFGLATGEALSNSEDEVKLVKRAKTDPTAFGVLYERYVGRIYNYVYYRTGDYHEAEDLTARTFQRAMTHIAHYRERGVPFSAWLYRIAHNLVANWHRDRSRRPVSSLDGVVLPGLSHERPEAVTESNQDREQLLAAIRRLPPERQQLLILKFVERMSNAEVGKVMGRSEGAVKSLYFRTLISLRDELGLSDVISAEGSDSSGIFPVTLGDA
jgi:RNA polymerase sigma-70 factor (ECF subfamily)